MIRARSADAKADVTPVPRVRSEKKPARQLKAQPRSKGSRAERDVIDPQAEAAAARTETPVVVHRVNRADWRASLPEHGLTSLLFLNGNPPSFVKRYESGRIQLWSWIMETDREASSRHPAGARAIPIVSYTWPGADSRWYSDLRFATLLELIREGES